MMIGRRCLDEKNDTIDIAEKDTKNEYHKKDNSFKHDYGILTAGLTACGSFDAENIPETQEVASPLPETYEDYMKLAAESYGKQDWKTALAYYQSA